MKESINKIDLVEIDGEKVKISDTIQMQVKNHWNYKDLVVIEVLGKKVTVLVNELQRAIENAQNIHRF